MSKKARKQNSKGEKQSDSLPNFSLDILWKRKEVLNQ